jgi:mRNA interferase YafQ
MRTPVYSGQFKRDLKAAQKRGKDMEKIKEPMCLLIEGKPLPPQYKDHPLKGNWSSFRDAHIEPDWLLVYKIDGDDVRFERTGRHADLFSE